VRLPTVQHLATEVTGRLPAGGGLLGLVGRLHPTPAVGGWPREAALAYIEAEEDLDRGWYAGPVGWVDLRGDGEFVVGIRSGVVSGSRASLFAGCGIVADSEPDREWEESEWKLRALATGLGRIVDDGEGGR
jgi:isochorismate synthase EntC